MDKQEMVCQCGHDKGHHPKGKHCFCVPACGCKKYVPVEPAQPLPRELPLVNIDRGLDLSPELVSDLYEEWENPVKHTCDLERCLGCESWTRHVQEIQQQAALKRIAELEEENSNLLDTTVDSKVYCKHMSKLEAENASLKEQLAVFEKVIAEQIPVGEFCCEGGYMDCPFEEETFGEDCVCKLTNQHLKSTENYHLKCAGCPVPAPKANRQTRPEPIVIPTGKYCGDCGWRDKDYCDEPADVMAELKTDASGQYLKHFCCPVPAKEEEQNP